MPNIQVRPATTDEAEAFRFITSTVFAWHPDEPPPFFPQYTLCAFEDGEMVSSFTAYPFTWQLNGAPVPTAGVAAVGTLPHRRRRGHLRRIMEESFRRQRAAGQSMAILWGAHTAIYQRFGYAVVAHDARYDIRPSDIDFDVPLGLPDPPPPGDVRITTNPTADQLRPIYDAYIADRNGQVHRNDELWHFGPLRPNKPEGPLYAALYTEPRVGQQDAPLGYALYTVRDGVYGPTGEDRDADEGQRLTLRELVATTPAAYRALWQTLASHDLVRRIHYTNAPEDDPLFDLIQEPRLLRRATQDGIMARIVDLAAALPQRPYGAPLSLRLRVIDRDCEWNDGLWAFQTDGQHTTVERTPIERSRIEPTTDAPQLTLPIHSLASLLTGYRSASQLVRIARAHATPGLDLTAIDQAFATAHRPHCLQHF